MGISRCSRCIIVIAVGVFAFAARLQAASILVWGTGTGANAGNVATYFSASNQFSIVNSSTSTTLPISTLSQYDAVLFFTDGSIGSDSNNGNVLADYADLNRRLVVCTFAWANQGANTLSGRLITSGMSPLLVQGSSLYTNVSLASKDTSPFWDSVNVINGYFHDNVQPSPGALVRGTWSDGEPLLATKNNIVAINLYPNDIPESISGDYKRLFVNAALIPEPAGAGLLIAASCLAMRRTCRRVKSLTR
jgi:hypothetical protein